MNGKALLAGVVTIGAACGAPGESSPRSHAPASTARHFTVQLDTLWSRSSADEQWAFIAAQSIAAGRGHLVLLDTEVVTFLDGAGQVRVRHAVPPGGRASASAALAIDHDGTAVVVRHGAITRVPADGGITRTVPLADEWSLHTACTPASGTVVLSAGPVPIALVGGDGRLTREWPYPWPALRDSALLLQQVLVASTPGVPGCVIAQSVGSGFATTADGTQFDTATYIERVALPVVTTRVDSTPDGVVRRQSMPPDIIYTARRLAASARYVVIGFGGATPRRRGLIDVYDRATRAYLGSAMLEAPILDLAASGDTLFVLHELRGTPHLAALRLRLSPAAP